MSSFKRIYRSKTILLFLFSFSYLFTNNHSQAAYECDTKYKDADIPTCNRDPDCFYYQGNIMEEAHCANIYGGRSVDSCGQNNIYCYADQNCSLSGTNHFCEQKTYDTCKPLRYDNAITSYGCYRESFAPEGWIIADNNHKCSDRSLICYYKSGTFGEPVNNPLRTTTTRGTISFSGDSKISPDKVNVTSTISDNSGGESTMSQSYTVSGNGVAYEFKQSIATKQNIGQLTLSVGVTMNGKQVGTAYNTYTITLGDSVLKNIAIPLSNNPSPLPSPTFIPGKNGTPSSGSEPDDPGYCGDQIAPPAGATPVKGATCDPKTAYWDGVAGTNEYCAKTTGNKYIHYYICPTASGGNPGNGPIATPTLTPNKFPDGVCANAGGPIGYLEPRCGLNGKFDANKAKVGSFFNETYYDVYICKNKDSAGKNILDPYRDPTQNTTDNMACNKAPWSFLGPSETPKPTDPLGCATQGIDCSYDPDSKDAKQTGSCCASQNLYCMPVDYDKQNGTCQYKVVNGTPQVPTPTAGASTSCAPGNKYTGCKCGTLGGSFNGGCNSAYDCVKAWDSNDFFCAVHGTGQSWCKTLERQTTEIACSNTTPTATPTPNYSFACQDPNDKCMATRNCNDGYVSKNTTDGNKACKDFEPSTPFCCVKATPTPTTTTSGGALLKCEAANFQCQAGINGDETDPSKMCVAGWSPSNERGGCATGTRCCKAN